MIQIIWEFFVPPTHCLSFEKNYASDGPWAKLFRRSTGYQYTHLLRDLEAPGRYLTVDLWDSMESYKDFRRDYDREYKDLDEVLSGITTSERRLGWFEQM